MAKVRELRRALQIAGDVSRGTDGDPVAAAQQMAALIQRVRAGVKNAADLILNGAGREEVRRMCGPGWLATKQAQPDQAAEVVALAADLGLSPLLAELERIDDVLYQHPDFGLGEEVNIDTFRAALHQAVPDLNKPSVAESFFEGVHAGAAAVQQDIRDVAIAALAAEGVHLDAEAVERVINRVRVAVGAPIPPPADAP